MTAVFGALFVIDAYCEEAIVKTRKISLAKVKKAIKIGG